MMNRVLCAAILALAVSSAARAQNDAGETVAYRAKQGDTLELVAAEFYGDPTAAPLIAAENKLTHPKPLHPGERIKVPVPREVVTAKGDSFESLASTYLGDAKRATFLAEFNAMSIDDSLHLPVGITVAIPIQVTHTAASNETFQTIATTYFGDGKQADVVRRYNFLDKSSVDKGENVLVPALNLKVRESRLPALDADAKSRREQRAKVIQLAATTLPKAQAAWARGDFAQVRAVLAGAGEGLDYLDASTAVSVALLLGRADVAFDDTDHAVADLAQVLDRKPRYRLSAYAESPKVIAAWKKAGGHLDDE